MHPFILINSSFISLEESLKTTVLTLMTSSAVHINSLTIHDEPGLPHGGVKKSGFGRFGGTAGLNEFLTTKSVTWMDI